MKIKFKVQRNCANTRKISLPVSFYQYLQVFHMNFKICFRHLVLLEINSFEAIFKTTAQKFAIRRKNLGTSFCSLVSPTSGGFLLKLFVLA